MKREITHSELFRIANRRAADLIAADKRPTRFTIDPVTRAKVYVRKERTLTRSQALSQAFRELYAQYQVVTTTSVKEQLQRQTSRREWEEITNFQSHPVWNRSGRTND